MKKKIVLFASAVIAAMAMTAPVFAEGILGDVNSSNGLDAQDAAWILEQALSKDYASTNAEFVLENANADQDKPFANTGEITANDAALVYKLAFDQKTLKLVVVTQKYGETTIADLDTEFNGFDTGIRELVEGKLAKIGESINNPDSKINSDKNKNRLEEARKRAKNALGKVKFKVNGKNVTLYDQAGWDILGYAANPLLKTPIYDDAAYKADLGVADDASKNYGRLQDAEAKAVAAKVDAVSLPQNKEKLDANAKDAFTFASQVYDVAFGAEGVLKTAPSAADVKESKNRVLDIIKDKKYGGTLDLVYNNEVKTTYTLSKDKSKSNEDVLIDAFDGFDYNTATVKSVYDKYAELAGVTSGSKDDNDVYGKIVAKAGKHDVELILEESK